MAEVLIFVKGVHVVHDDQRRIIEVGSVAVLLQHQRAAQYDVHATAAQPRHVAIAVFGSNAAVDGGHTHVHAVHAVFEVGLCCHSRISGRSEKPDRPLLLDSDADGKAHQHLGLATPGRPFQHGTADVGLALIVQTLQGTVLILGESKRFALLDKLIAEGDTLTVFIDVFPKIFEIHSILRF